MELERFAPAKINLFLHVGALGDDGYHPLCSLVTFANVGDKVRIRVGHGDGFSIEGPFADGLSAEADNLVTRARDLCLEGFPGEPPSVRLTLEKRLPIASGVGGGSSDAAATLVLMREALGLDWLEGDEALDDPLIDLALKLGSDVPMCLNPEPALAQARGEMLDFPPVFPALDAVLVNPGVPVPTGGVFRAFDGFDLERSAEAPVFPERMETAGDVAQFLAGCRNDLEAPAISLQPAIGEVLKALKDRPETLLARMSGSGATCFAICADPKGSHDLAFSLSSAHPTWWVQRCVLAGFCP
jgi:4-diphosphocytidyl-2-C-methyl-D-erythritol kinase